MSSLEATRPGVLALVLGAVWVATFLVFRGALEAGFVAYDDPLHILENEVVLRGWSLESLRFAATTLHSANWHPLTWASHITDVELFGLNAGGHHLTSILFHATNASLLALLLLRLGAGAFFSAAGALVFAIHPLRVESVAWISERKDVLSGFFLFLLLLAWERYAHGGPKRRRAYAAALFFFACGLMSKPMLVTVPALLLVFDVWPLARMRTEQPRLKALLALVFEKAPFGLLALGVSLATIHAQSAGGAVSKLEGLSLSMRSENALVSVGRYAWKTVWPDALSPHYLFPLEGWPPSRVALAAAFFLLMSGAALLFARRGARTRTEALLAAWLWFLVSLSPVLGFIFVGTASMADRYTYVPHVLPIVALALLAARARVSGGRRAALDAGTALVCVLLALASMRQVEVWRDTRTLFRHAVHVEPENAHAWAGLGLAELARGDLTAAREAAERSVALRPHIAPHWILLGRIVAAEGDHAAAIEHFVEGLSLDAAPGASHAFLALSLFAVGDIPSARMEAAKALAAPDTPPAMKARLQSALAAHGPPG
jgi:protein O-mannosyl-transferase